MQKMKWHAMTLFLLMLANNIYAQSKASFRVQDINVTAGQEAEIPVCVDNPMEFNGLQLSVTLPEGLEFAPYRSAHNSDRVSWAKLNAARCDDSHSIVTSRAPKNNRMTFLAYSPQNEPFIGNSGELLRFKVKAAEDTSPGVYYVTIDNMEFSDMQNQSVEQDVMTAKVFVVDASEATSIDNIETLADGDAKKYNVQGQRITDNQRGIVITDNHKYIKK